MEFFDTHCHLNDEQVAGQEEAIYRQAQAAGVQHLFVAGFDALSSQQAVEIAEKYPTIWAGVGIHPHDAEQLNATLLQTLGELAQSKKVVAIGEIGLDYHYENSPRELQKQVFVQQIALAHDLHLPIVIHDREAHGDVLEILQREQGGKYGGIIHCFSGSWEFAQQAMELGFYISFAGPLTYKNASKLQEVARRIPLDRLLIETDSPYLAPQKVRGSQNQPANVVLVAEKLAELRGLDLAEIAAITLNNAKSVYQLS